MDWQFYFRVWGHSAKARRAPSRRRACRELLEKSRDCGLKTVARLSTGMSRLKEQRPSLRGMSATAQTRPTITAPSGFKTADRCFQRAQRGFSRRSLTNPPTFTERPSMQASRSERMSEPSPATESLAPGQTPSSSGETPESESLGHVLVEASCIILAFGSIVGLLLWKSGLIG